jgi:NAD dependent epimerase/dehydratase family enzyme
VWLQASTATLYAHRFDAANDEASGLIGGAEPGAPPYWRWSIDIARAWEQALADAPAATTRKVALRIAMVMSTAPGSVFDVLLRLSRLGLNGAMAGGRQYVSWIHQRDFVRAVAWLLEHDEISGPVNLCAPEPLPQREFARVLRAACGRRIGVPSAAWMLECGAVVLRTDTELLLKSRRVVPARLLSAGFRFEFPTWSAAACELAARRRGQVFERSDALLSASSK